MAAAQASPRGDDRLLLAVLVAGALHVMLIFGITFDALRPGPAVQQVEVTLLQRPGERVRDARHIAAADQAGSGEEALRDLSSGDSSALQLPTQAPSAASAGLTRADRGSTAVTSPRGERRVAEQRGEAEPGGEMTAADRELARLNDRLAQLEASLAAQNTTQSTQPRVRRVEAVSARAAADAAYLAEWRRRVETVGNQYYPQASLRYGIYGALRMLVTVRSDGSLEDVRLLESSGYAVLDEAALRIVRLAAPSPPFPPELQATTDKLEIVRTWQFEQNPLSSN
jgi:protein TonB